MSDPINSVLLKKVTNSLFKEPKAPVKRVKKRSIKVLDEDSYLEKMGKIIERDYFPDLKKLNAQNDYLDAVSKKDAIRMKEIYMKYTGSQESTERYNSPATFETPVDLRPSEDAKLREEEKAKNDEKVEDSSDPEKKLSLDQYLATHTSEDNVSFEDIIEDTERRRKQQFPWLYKDEKDNSEALKERLALPGIAEQFAETKRPLELDMWGYKNKNYIMYVPDGVELTAEEKVEMANKKQEVVHCNTRLRANPFDEVQNKQKIQGMAQQQVKVLDGKIGVDGKELMPKSPKINGYGFVKTPSPAPGITDTPLMTWGEIEGTPFRLDGGDTPRPNATPGPSFWIPEPPSREKLAHKLADQANQDIRNRKKRALEAKQRLVSPRVGTSLEMMSPAAQRLATSSLRKAISTDKMLQASYSPVPPSPSRTPRVAPSTPITTDNLLNITVPSRRPTAADFF